MLRLFFAGISVHSLLNWLTGGAFPGTLVWSKLGLGSY